MSAPLLPRPIESHLRRFVRRRRALDLLRALGTALFVGLAWMTLACLLDRLWKLPPAVRLGLLVGDALVVLAILAGPLRRAASRRVDYLAAAAHVEATCPVFGQRLATVVSQLLERPGYRGSGQMLATLADEVAVEAQLRRPSRALPAVPALRPAGAALALALVATLVGLAPGMDGATLARRFLAPLSGVAPVTTTRLAVEPGDVRLERGQTLSVRATVERLDNPSLDIFTSTDGRSFSRIPMVAVSDDRFVFTLAAVEHDLVYYVAGGDARSKTYRVKVLRPPALLELRLRCEFPAYTGRAPAELSTSDGHVEALEGTRLKLSVVATEPIREAQLVFGQGEKAERLTLTRTSQPNVFQGEWTVRRSQSADLVMTSADGQAARHPNALVIRSQPDREPVVRLIEPADDLRLHPRDLLVLRYQFLDDFGLTSMAVSAAVPGRPAALFPIPRDAASGDARRQEGAFTLDLADLNARVGDVVTLSLVATDGTGRKVQREARQLLISPGSVDVETYRLAEELRGAQRLGEALARDAEQAAAGFDAVRRASSAGEALAERLRVGRALSSASETAMLLHQSLLRVAANPRSEEAAALLADLVDRARTTAATAERLALLQADAAGDGTAGGGGAAEGATAREAALSQRLATLAGDARQLSGALTTWATGRHAAVVLAEQANLKLLPPERAAADARLRETLKRVHKELEEAVGELGLSDRPAELEARLNRRADAAAALVRSARAPDLVGPARPWAQALRSGGDAGDRGSAAARVLAATPLPERLASAAALEALRPAGNPVRAQDLHLAGRAAARLAERAMRRDEEERPEPLWEPGVAAFGTGAGARGDDDADETLASDLAAFSGALAALDAEHRALRATILAGGGGDGAATAGASRPEPAVIAAAADARAFLARVATAPVGMPPATRPAATAPSAARDLLPDAGELAAAVAADLEVWALRASALMARRQYPAASAADAELRRRAAGSTESPGPASAPAARKALDELPRAVERAAALDGAAAAQQDLASRTAQAAAAAERAGGTVAEVEAQADALAAQQRELASRIDQVGPAVRADSASVASAASPSPTAAPVDSRRRARAAVGKAQEELTLLPQRLTAALAAAEAARAADEAADAAERQAEGQAQAADPAALAAAQRQATQARLAAKEARARLDAAAAPLMPELAQRLARELAPFAPEASDARQTLLAGLDPALGALRDSLKGDAGDLDRDAIGRAARAVREAVARAQVTLRDAQLKLLEQDPAVAARFYAEAAAEALAERPPDFRKARRHQDDVALALHRGWLENLRRAGTARLLVTPTYGPVLLPRPAGADAPQEAAAARGVGRLLPAVREWGFLPQRAPDGSAAGPRSETPAPGFLESLRIYFEALNKPPSTEKR